MNEWIGVDLDGTLAEWNGWVHHTSIGRPIPKMVNRVKQWIKEGKTVKIFTARAQKGGHIGDNELQETLSAIESWCLIHIGKILPITATKDYDMKELYDDRAKQVIPNIGILLQDVYNYLLDTYDLTINYDKLC